MSDSELTANMRAALEALIAEAATKGPGRIMTAAERDAVLQATKLEGGPRAIRSTRPAELGSTRVWVH